MTVAELLDRITELRHKEAIWSSVADYLHQFLEQDIGEPRTLSVEECMVPNVPRESVEGVLEESVYTRLEEIEKELMRLKDLKVGDGEQESKTKRKRASSKRAKSDSDDNKPTARTSSKKPR